MLSLPPPGCPKGHEVVRARFSMHIVIRYIEKTFDIPKLIQNYRLRLMDVRRKWHPYLLSVGAGTQLVQTRLSRTVFANTKRLGIEVVKNRTMERGSNVSWCRNLVHALRQFPNWLRDTEVDRASGTVLNFRQARTSAFGPHG